MDELLGLLMERQEQLKQEEAQAIHGLGFVQGRVEELHSIVQLLEERQLPTEVKN